MLKSNLHTKTDLDAGFMALRAGLQYNIYNCKTVIPLANQHHVHRFYKVCEDSQVLPIS